MPTSKWKPQYFRIGIYGGGVYDSWMITQINRLSDKVPPPSELSLSEYDIVKEAERNMAGELTMTFVAKKRKIEVIWNFMYDEQAQSLRELLDLLKKGSPFMTVTFASPASGGYDTMVCYAGNRDFGTLTILPDGTKGWLKVRCNFIER